MNAFSISSSVALQILSALCSFLLRLTLGYAICAALARLAVSASVRFSIWLMFLVSGLLYWVYCVIQLIPSQTGGVQLNAPVRTAVALSAHTVHGLGPILLCAVAVYGATLFCAFLVSSWKRIQLSRILRFRTPAPRAIGTLMESVRAEISGPRCGIWVLPGLPSPAALGLLRSDIYLPAVDTELEADLADILRHELAHLRRRDALWDMLAAASRWCLFFHPLVHRAYASMRLERELACDAIVVRHNCVDRIRYADTLLRFGWKATLADEPERFGLGLSSQATLLNVRVLSILKGEQFHSKWSKGMRALLSSAACWAFVIAAPALWVGFRLSTQPLSHVASQTEPARHSPAHAHRKRPLVQASTPASVAFTTKMPAPSPEVAYVPQTREHRPVYHIQNEDEPMSNPVAVASEENTSSQDGTPARSPGNAALKRSVSNVVLDSATQLANMGLGRGRDHDHD